ncbi:MAG: hypothetical protein U0271_18670 [Polyangiaceae bacterium]
MQPRDPAASQDGQPSGRRPSSSTIPRATTSRGHAPDAALIKGGAIREFLLWYETRFGRAYVERMLKRLPRTEAQFIWPERQALGIVINDWYPSPVVHALLDAIFEDLDEPVADELIREAGGFVVRRLSRGLYQFLFRMVASPGLYAKHVQKAWSQLHNTGLRRIELSRNCADSTIEDWPGHHPRLCQITMETMRQVFEAMGCRDVRLERIACVSRGDDLCRAKLHYVEGR